MTNSGDNVSNDEIEVFVGPNVYYYLRKWTQLEGQAAPISTNFDAFLAHFYWAAYRKMYSHTAITITILLITAFIDIWFGLQKYLLRTVFVATMAIYGLFGNYMYQKHTMKQINLLRKNKTEHDQYIATLAVKGGISIKGLIITTCCLALSLFIISLPVAIRQVLSKH